MSAVDCPSSFNLMDLQDIYKFFTVRGDPPCFQILVRILPCDYLPATKVDASIQATAYKMVEEPFRENHGNHQSH
eukprot:6912281-Ditylum_brightwellii.AAC.1